MCNRLTQRFGVHVIDEAPPTVDLNHRDPLAVGRLELGIAVDRHLLQLETDLVACSRDDAPSRLAQVTARRGEEDDLRYG